MGLLHLVISTLSNYGRQCLFAVAPIPAYLPQYWTLCNTNDPVLRRRKQLLLQSSQNQLASKSLSKSPSFNDNNSLMIGTSGNANGTGTVDNSFEVGGGSTGSNMMGSSGAVTEGGFSSTSIMILLLSHAFRLQYFFISAILSTFYQSNDVDDDNVYKDNIIKDTARIHHSRRKADKVHFDLVMQSFVMIGIQLLLLSAVTRRKRLSHKKKVDDDDSYTVSATSKRSSGKSSRSSSLSQRPFIWIYKPTKHWHWDTVHQHVELLVVILVLEYIIFKHYIYPNNTMDYIQTVKNISVLLESCLALPQMILNYQRKSTEGLSLVMVIGWVLGDLLKLLYFLGAYSKGNGNVSGVEHAVTASGSAVKLLHHDEHSSDMVAFMVGSLCALVLDSIVVLQLIKWYPTTEFKSLAKRMRRFPFLSRFFRRKDIIPLKKRRRGSSIDDFMP